MMELRVPLIKKIIALKNIEIAIKFRTNNSKKERVKNKCNLIIQQITVI